MATIFVFGATGTVGSHVAKQLADKGIHFKAGVRDAAKGEELKKKYGDKVEPVIVNLYDQNSLDAALKGIEKVFLATPPGKLSLKFRTISCYTNVCIIGQTIVPCQNVGQAAKSTSHAVVDLNIIEPFCTDLLFRERREAHCEVVRAGR